MVAFVVEDPGGYCAYDDGESRQEGRGEVVAFSEGEDKAHDGYFSSEEGEGQSHFQAEINCFLFIFIGFSLCFLDLPIGGNLVDLGHMSCRASFHF